MAYKGSDLSPEFKTFFRAERKRITAILTKMGCTNVQMDYGFYFFSGFFTSNSGQIYYLSVDIDQRPTSYERIMYRTAKHYKDYTGCSNQWINKNDIRNMQLI